MTDAAKIARGLDDMDRSYLKAWHWKNWVRQPVPASLYQKGIIESRAFTVKGETRFMSRITDDGLCVRAELERIADE